MDKKDETMDQLGGQTLPGTGGDYIDGGDVEGHRAKVQKAVEDEAGPEGQKRMVSYSDEEDVEGHGARRDAEPDGLYQGGPTNQGEVVRRGPGDNPNGDR